MDCSGRRDRAREAPSLALDIREQFQNCQRGSPLSVKKRCSKLVKGRLHDGPASNERIREWLESIDSEELGEIWDGNVGRPTFSLVDTLSPPPYNGPHLRGIALCGPFSDNRLDLVRGDACRDRVLR